jgi:predicted RNA-binding Zn-ribbon protein involved in translation (DUF1610 family)
MVEETKYHMKVIPEPAEGSRSVLFTNSPGPIMEGAGPRTYQCGTCGKTLIKRIRAMQVVDIVFKCGKCGSFNEIPTAHQGH